jgi:hypothetical protein
MEQEFNLLIENLNKLEGVKVLGSEFEPNTWIHFECAIPQILATISNQVDDVNDFDSCKILVLSHPDDQEKNAYQLIFNNDKEKYIAMLSKKVKNLVENGTKKARFQELGLPDLSLVTMRQMATELKGRQNLCFAMVWMEDNEKENISIEGNGNPTQLVGLLFRGLHMTIEWSNKNIKFKQPPEDS